MSHNDDHQYDDLDDDGGSDAEYTGLDDKIDFNLFEMQGGNIPVEGSLKSYKTKDGSLIFYKDDPTGFTISVERLLQADGYADSTKKQGLTLFVLKLVLACNSDSKIKRVVLNMRFEDIPPTGKNKAKAGTKVKPEVVAWAPFDDMSKTNEIPVGRENTTRHGLEAGGNGAGASAKASTGWESKITWTETYWQSGHAYPTFGCDQTRTGVRWVLSANPKDTEGLPPKFILGILLARQSGEPYLANFDLKVTGGLVHDLLKGIERSLGRKPDVTKPYKVTPSKEPIWRYNGFNMLKNVELNDMLKLRGKGEHLVLVWDDEGETDTAEKKKGETDTAEKKGEIDSAEKKGEDASTAEKEGAPPSVAN